MQYVLDIAVVALFAFCLWNGRRRGFIKAVTGLVALVAAFVAAVLLSGPVASGIFDSVMAPSMKVTIADQIDAAGTSVAGGLDGALEKLPGFVKNALAGQGVTSGSELLSRTGVGSGDGSAAIAEQIVTQTIRPVAVTVLRAIAFVLLLIVAYIAARLILYVLNKVFKLPLLSKLNKSLGLLAGALTGVLWAFIAVSILQLIASTASADAAITNAVIDQTLIVRWLCGISPIGSALRELIAAAK